MMPGAIGFESGVRLYGCLDGAAAGFEPCCTVGRHDFSDRCVLPCDCCGSCHGDLELITCGAGQGVVALAAVLEPEQYGRTALLLSAPQFSAVGSGELDPQCVRRRLRQSRCDRDCVSK